MANALRLEQLFSRCDTSGSGLIDSDDFQDLCAGFGIEEGDSDIIFADLDHDGDGKINFEDFSFGFRDFLTPGSRRGSLQLGLLPGAGPGLATEGFVEESLMENPKLQAMEAKHQRAKKAWKNFADNMGRDNIGKFLSMSGNKMLTLYEDLKTSGAETHLVEGFEDALSSLLKDVKNIENEHSKLEEMFNKERENHSAHLASIEAELDSQVAKVEAAARRQAQQDFEAERRAMQDKMEAEVQELQTHLRLFQKVDQWMSKDEQQDNDARKKLEDANQENIQLKSLLGETQTNIAVLRSDMTQIKTNYETKVTELTNEKEGMMEYVYQYDNLQKQLQLLHEANKKLQDTNDHIQGMVDMPSLGSQSPMPHRRALHSTISREDAYNDGLGGELQKLEKMFRSKQNRGSRSPSEFDGSLADGDSLRLKEMNRPKLSEVKFGIKRLMDDLDSGHSTLPGDEFDDMGRNVYFQSPCNLGSELESAMEDSFEAGLPSLAEEREEEEGQDLDGSIYGSRRSTKSLTLVIPENSSFGAGVFGNREERCSKLRDLEPTGPPDRTYKVVFAGDAAVGKTSFINRITKGVFMSNLSSTLGVDFQVKTIRVDDRNIAIQLWDTAGQERFRSVTKTYFRRADGVMLLYDVTSERSFTSVRHWVQCIDDVAEKRIPIILCGNKVDQRTGQQAEGRRCVGAEDGEKTAREHSAIFMETSSRDGHNILDSLVLLAREMCSSEDVEVQTSTLLIRDDKAKNNCCNSSKRTTSR